MAFVSRIGVKSTKSTTWSLLSKCTRGFANTAEWTASRPYKGYLITPPDSKVETTKEELLGFYTTLTLYRRVEIASDDLYKNRKIRGFCHLYDGQEAIVVGMEAAIKKTDSVITAYRDHCHQLGRGDTVESVMSELMWRSTGCSKGKGGSMHFYYDNFYGGNGIVGAQIPVGAGLAFAHKYKGDGGVTVAAYGDGAANQGQVYEAANMAGLWKLPLILVCENNHYGMGTSTKRAASVAEFYTKGASLGIPGLWIDGMDVLTVRKGFAFAAEYCRSGKGPIFLELSTYRYHGHSMSDPGVSYRPREEVDSVRKERDPVLLVRSRILEKGWATEKELKAIDLAARAKVEKAVEFAEKSPLPAAEELYTEVYKGTPPPYIRATDPTKSVIAKA
jgi:pyruvate dehydrogenase E1 component alpha subunit